MANIKSQKKRVLTNEKAHLRNVAVKSDLKTAQKLDKAAGAGVIHKNQAANRKSGLAVAINAL